MSNPYLKIIIQMIISTQLTLIVPWYHWLSFIMPDAKARNCNERTHTHIMVMMSTVMSQHIVYRWFIQSRPCSYVEIYRCVLNNIPHITSNRECTNFQLLTFNRYTRKMHLLNCCFTQMYAWAKFYIRIMSLFVLLK